VSGSNTVVEHLPCHFKAEGLSPQLLALGEKWRIRYYISLTKALSVVHTRDVYVGVLAVLNTLSFKCPKLFLEFRGKNKISLTVSVFQIQRHDTQYNDIQHNDTQHNDIQHNDNMNKGLICDTQCK
jgi:hypothetical protein